MSSSALMSIGTRAMTASYAALQATGWQQVRGHRDLAERHRFITAVATSRV